MAGEKQKIFLFYGNNSTKNQSDYKILFLILENKGYSEKQIIQLFEKNATEVQVKERVQNTNGLLKNFEVINVLLEITSGDEKQNSDEIQEVKKSFEDFKVLNIDEFIAEITKSNSLENGQKDSED